MFCVFRIFNNTFAWQENPRVYAMLRHVVDDCAINSGWRWLDSVDLCLQGKGVKFLALVTAAQHSQEAENDQFAKQKSNRNLSSSWQLGSLPLEGDAAGRQNPADLRLDQGWFVEWVNSVDPEKSFLAWARLVDHSYFGEFL